MINSGYVLILFLAAGILSCTSITGQRMPEEGSIGLALMKQKCKICHGLPHPRRHTPEEWNHLMDIMTERMTEKKVQFNESEIQTIKSYLQRNAR